MTARQLILFAALAVSVAGCGFGASRLNPFNWFGGGAEVETLEPFQIAEVEDRRPLVSEVTGLVIERTPGGAIIRATGLPPTQGWYNAGLVSEDDGEPIDGVLSFSLRSLPPASPTRVSTVQSRELSVAVFISDIALAPVRTIRVTGATNSRAARR